MESDIMTLKDIPDTVPEELTGNIYNLTSLQTRMRKALKLKQGKKNFHKKPVTL